MRKEKQENLPYQAKVKSPVITLVTLSLLIIPLRVRLLCSESVHPFFWAHLYRSESAYPALSSLILLWARLYCYDSAYPALSSLISLWVRLSWCSGSLLHLLSNWFHITSLQLLGKRLFSDSLDHSVFVLFCFLITQCHFGSQYLSAACSDFQQAHFCMRCETNLVSQLGVRYSHWDSRLGQPSGNFVYYK